MIFKTYEEMTPDQQVAYRLGRQSADPLLKLAIECIEGLAGQQAMPDDFYLATLTRLREAL